MKQLKMILCLLLALCMLFACMTACTTEQPSSATEGQGTDAAEETESPTETDTPQVVLTFSPDCGGMEAVTVELPADAQTVTLPEDPVREGYAFKGWYTEPNGAGERITCATAQTGDKTYYAKWTEAIDMTNRNHIRIGGFNGITESGATEADFAALAECGVDEIYMTWFHDDTEDGTYTLAKSMQYKEWMEKYGIQCWYNDFKLNDMLKNHASVEDCMALLNVYKDSPSYCGNYMADEPAGDSFPVLIDAVTYFKEIMPGYQMYINLLPNFAPATAYIEGSFEKYMRAFAEQFPLSYVSQDFYPIEIVSKKRTVSTYYYDSLYTEACAARDNGKDAWMYIYTMRDTVNSNKNYEPTITDVRFEANTALAFGNSHIAYYCFDCPPSYAKTTSFGMLKNHEKTTLFDVGVQITKEIKALSDVYPRYIWQDCCYTGGKKMTHAIGKTLKTASEVLPFTLNTESDTLIGIFEEANGDGCAYMFVNHSDLNKTEETATLTFTMPEAQKLIAHIGTETKELTAQDGVYTLTLGCGQGCFLEVIR